MAEVVTYLERLREIALDQHGFVTTAQAVADGVAKTELPRLASRGRAAEIQAQQRRVPGAQFERLMMEAVASSALKRRPPVAASCLLRMASTTARLARVSPGLGASVPSGL